MKQIVRIKNEKSKHVQQNYCKPVEYLKYSENANCLPLITNVRLVSRYINVYRAGPRYVW